MIKPRLFLLILVIVGAILVLPGRQACATGSIAGNSVSPGSGTANSIYRFRIVYSDQTTDYAPRWPDSLVLYIGSTRIQFPIGDSRFQNGFNRYNGVELFLYASAGLDQKNQWPASGTGGNKGQPGYFLPDYRVHYVPDLVAKGNGDRNPDIEYWWEMVYTDPISGDITRKTVPQNRASAPTIYDTTRRFNPLIDAYAGQAMGEDYMYAFPDGWPFYRYVDPLDVTNRTFPTPGEDPTQFPDEGSSTSTYTFRVTYDSYAPERYGVELPARPWMLGSGSAWSMINMESGVMLYIRNLDWANLPTDYEKQYWKYFHGHHMYKEDFDVETTPLNYLLRVGPTGPGLIRSGSVDHWMTTWARTYATNRYYEALPPGRYEYYLACSDDDYSAWATDDLKNTVWPQLEETPPMPTASPPNDLLFNRHGLNYKRAITDDNPTQSTVWTASKLYSLGDFVRPTVQNGKKYECVQAGTSGGSQPVWPINFGSYVHDGSVWWACAGAERPGSYVDKMTYMPGAWTSGYPYDSWVGQSFGMPFPNLDDQQIQYRAFTYPIVNPGLFEVTPLVGGTKFLGTLAPYKRAVDPNVPGQEGNSFMRLWAENAGGTDSDVFTFKVNYWQSAGIAPSYVALYIKNGWNADDGQPYQRYPMYISPGQGLTGNEFIDPRYRTIDPLVPGDEPGVRYECQLNFAQLGRGSHCYYFEAADQEWTDVRYTGRSATVSPHICRFPRRPDKTDYHGGSFYDHTLPNGAVGDGIPVENDIVNGPWINTKPQFANNSWRVSPTSGPSGTNFRFMITYQDADNQRPYRSDVTIETDDAGTTWTGSMVRAVKRDNPNTPDDEDPWVPADNLTRAYSDGVVYEWNTSSAPGLRLQIGSRQFRFAFSDNWGSPVENDDNISGEPVYAPGGQTPSGWLSFAVTGNSAPRLTNGNVRSADGTSNDATTWDYAVTYTDADNQGPQWILVFIGRQDTPPNGPIAWDSGHVMERVTTNQYNTGVQFSYSTRLPGDNATPKKYYHCFVASDGVDVADYNSATSPSSGMVWRTAESLGTLTTNPQLFGFAHNPLVTDIPPSSEDLNPTNYVSPLIYHGSTLLSSGQYVMDALAGTVNISVVPSSPASAVTAKYWFATEPGSMGPQGVTGNNAPVLTNGQVAPAKGESTTMFTYSVTYQDLDGQATQFINVVADGATYPMVNVSGSTTYKEGVTYTYKTNRGSGNHTFHFEASDGSALTIFEGDPSTPEINPIEGPFVNDHPTFNMATINPAGTINTSQSITYSITYRDNDNEGPNAGYPIVYIDNPTEQDWNGTVGAIGDDFVESSNITENWTPDQFAGMPVQITLAGTSQRIVYKIKSNTANRLTLVGSDLSSVITQGSEFTIGKLLMVKQDPTDQIFSDSVGMVYEAKAPSLGMGTHAAHFKAVTTEVTLPGQTADYTLRYPTTDDISGPVVTRDAPAGNVSPTLTNGGSTPQTGTAGAPFRFTVTYTDANGDPPIGNFEGYLNLVVEETPGVFVTHPMEPTDPAPQYSLGVEYAYTLSLSSVGDHQFHFEASDGWFSVRLPSSGYFTAYVSRPPILTQGEVIPTTGNSGRVYEYKVKYTDLDNNPPTSIKLYIDGLSPIEMSVPMPGVDYSQGVLFTYPTSKGALAEDLHTFYFEATDGYGYSWYDDDTMGTLTKGAPDVFADGYLSTTAGECSLRVVEELSSSGDSITFTVTGVNQNGVAGRMWTATFNKAVDYDVSRKKLLTPTVAGDLLVDVTSIAANAWTAGKVRTSRIKNSNSSTPPTPIEPINGPSVHSNTALVLTNGSVTPTTGYDLDPYTYTVTYSDLNGDEPEFVEVYIDGSAPAQAYKMTKTLPSVDYVTGVQYRYIKQGLAPGIHSYFFKASDWLEEVSTTTVNNSPVVQGRAPASISLSVPSSVTIGNEIAAEGYIRGYGGTPLSVDLNLALTKPDNAVTNVTVHSAANGYFKYTWTPLVTGVWTVQATWPGNSQYQTSASPIRTVTAMGPSTVVNGLDMISIPLAGISISPEGVFGTNPPFALAKWLPAKKAYKLYSLLPGVRTDFDFPAMATGQGYWIKTLESKAIAPAGSLVNDQQDFTVALGAGWNQIGSPFTFDVEWSSLRIRFTSGGVTQNVSLATAAANGWVKDYGWKYDQSSGNYSLVRASGADHLLVPWKGYWIKSTINCTLIIPTSRSGGNITHVLNAESEMPTSETPKWQVKLTASNGRLKDECNYFGASRSSTERIESPGCLENYVDLSFTTDQGGAYATDLRGNLSGGDSWQFVVETDRAGEIVLEWDDLKNVPSSANLALVDLAENRSMTITPGGSYRFRADEGGLTRSFRIDYQSR